MLRTSCSRLCAPASDLTVPLLLPHALAPGSDALLHPLTSDAGMCAPAAGIRSGPLPALIASARTANEADIHHACSSTKRRLVRAHPHRGLSSGLRCQRWGWPFRHEDSSRSCVTGVGNGGGWSVSHLGEQRVRGAPSAGFDKARDAGGLMDASRHPHRARVHRLSPSHEGDRRPSCPRCVRSDGSGLGQRTPVSAQRRDADWSRAHLGQPG